MTRSLKNWRQDGDSDRPSGLSQKIWVQIIGLLAFVGLASVACSWMLSDITGEYGANDGRQGSIHMSIIRKATTIKGELAYGSGALLETTAPFASAGDQLNWTFSIPDRWIEQGQSQHIIYFHGKVVDGVVTGVLQDGAVVTAIKLPRNAIASIYRQLQSHLPWVS